MKRTRTEQQVLEKLNIDDFRHMSKDKMIEFVSSIPDMPKELAAKCIEQFPKFIDQANSTLDMIKETCDVILSKADNSRKDVVEGYKKVIDYFEELSKDENLSIEQRIEIGNRLEEVSDKLALIHDKHLDWLGRLLKTVLSGAVAVLGMCLTILSIGKIDIPGIDKLIKK